ncbi:CPBP family intramembrane glutamic endopeptidase [Thalassococcus sp. S3]|uniref:CPBP family intramembrane glutamic endopeptidase n=1 Tax=Thalassococcus sp. S3 TaxID=2017482 RepID=UPI0013EE7BF2|nr:CPBP family intramembrane glutamic endopeptidase [Thalassococcus sp. S3]
MRRSKSLGLWLALAGPGLIALLSVLALQLTDTLVLRAIFLVAFALLLVAVYRRASGPEGISAKRLGLRPLRLQSLLIAGGLTAFFIFVFGPFAYGLVDWLDLGDFSTGLSRLDGLPVWYLLLTILIVAGGEEWLYRCYAIERLTDLTGSIWLAGMISLAVFVVVHYPLWGLGPTLTVILSGAILTVAYILTRDIHALVIAHIATDIYGLLITPS